MSRERGRQEGVDDSLRPQPIPRDFPHRAGGKGECLQREQRHPAITPSVASPHSPWSGPATLPDACSLARLDGIKSPDRLTKTANVSVPR
jgi:hypothetical protein